MFDTLSATISVPRLGTYLVAANQNRDLALALYIWNAQMGEAFHVPIQALEVGLRNRINHGLIEEFGVDWWREDRFIALLDNEGRTDLETVERRIRNRKLDLETPQIVAGVSFGFWVGMLGPRYNPNLWSKRLRTAFPHFPANRSRKSLHGYVGQIAQIRNRISHHEPIFKRDLSKDYSLMMEVLGWICPTKAGWVRPHCRVQDLLRQKPK